MKQRLIEYWQDIKARFRGERRIAPHGIRGRVYARELPRAGAVYSAKAEPTARLRLKIMRRTGEIEYRDIPATIVKR